MSKRLRSLNVFCGSRDARAEMTEATARLGALMAERGIRLVYGGGSVGLMGIVSQSVHSVGGDVLGVITEALKPVELSGEMVGTVLTVETMMERKTLMADNADAFLALPGGLGTADELLEVFSMAKLGFINKPVAVLNTCGFYDTLVEFFKRCVQENFLSEKELELLIVADTPEEALDRLEERCAAASAE